MESKNKVQVYEKNEKLRLYIDNEFDDVSENFETKVKEPVMNLFVWSVLLNRNEMAKIFWQIGEVRLDHQLVCVNLDLEYHFLRII